MSSTIFPEVKDCASNVEQNLLKRISYAIVDASNAGRLSADISCWDDYEADMVIEYCRRIKCPYPAVRSEDEGDHDVYLHLPLQDEEDSITKYAWLAKEYIAKQKAGAVLPAE